MSNTKTVLITGAARRIGAALALALHQAGYNVVIHYRRSETEAKKLAQQCCELRSNSAIAVQGDLDKINDISALINTVKNTYSSLDIVINNASEYFPTKIGETTEQQWLDLTKSNLMSPFFVSQAALPLLQKSQGCIINMTDTNVTHPRLTYSVYTSAKAGLNTLTRALAMEFAPEVRVNAIAIGAVFFEKDENNAWQQIPLKRHCTVEEIIQTALFLINNSFITGQIVTIDGGKSL